MRKLARNAAITTLCAVGLLAASMARANEDHGAQVRHATLLPVGNVSGARGQAMTQVLPGGSQHFKIEADGLQANTDYDIILDGNKLGTVSSGDDGEFEAQWGAPPHGDEMLLPPSFLPVGNIKQVDVATGGQNVLSGTFGNPVGGGGGGEGGGGGGGGGGGNHGGPSPTSFTFDVLHLTATSAAPAAAEGVAMTRFFQLSDGTTRQDLKVSVDGLLPGTMYEVVVDGNNAGPILTDDDGDGHLFLSNQSIPGALPLPSALEPVTGLKHVEVQDGSGTADLTGDFANGQVIQQNKPAGMFLGVAVLRDGRGRPIGMAATQADSVEERLDVFARHLAASASYQVVVDGTTAGTVQSDANGNLAAVFSSSPTGDELQLPTALQPVSGLMHIEIQDGGGNVVASGNFRATEVAAGSAHQGALRRQVEHH